MTVTARTLPVLCGQTATLGQWSEPVDDNDHRRPAGIELRHLAALEAVGRECSFRAAADSLGYVQSAVSHQIAALERIVDVRLVERSRGNAPVSLTAAGALLIEHSTEILAQFRAAQVKLAALDDGSAGTLRIGVFQSVAANVLPRVMASFARTCPDFRVEPAETHDDRPLFDLLERGLVDLCFCEMPYMDGPFEGIELMQDPFVLVVAESSPLAMRDDPPALDEIARLPLIGFNTSRSQDRMVAQLASLGVEPRFAFRTDLNPTMQSLVAANLGVAVVPYLTIDPLHAGTTVFPLDDLDPRAISLIWHRDRGCSTAGATFAETARSVSPRFRRAQATAPALAAAA